MHNDQIRDLRSFGRRRGRKLSERQEQLLDELLPKIAIDLTKAPEAQGLLLGQDLWLEIGFGGAEHLLWQAERNASVTLIGCEPFEEGVVKALTGIADQGLSNVRLHADDARAVLRWLPPASLSRVFILFPDPWPKKRHQKRRLINAELMKLLARAMKPQAQLRFGTDIGDYARTALLAILGSGQFGWLAASAEDWRVRPEDWPGTRYEAKGHREGRRCYYFRFERI